MRVFLLLIFSLCVCVWHPSQVSAVATSVSPAFVEVQLTSATTSAQTSLTIRNGSERPQTFSLSVADISQVDSEGQVQLLMKPAEGNALAFAKYVQIATPEIEIPGSGQATIKITVNNAQDLSPGGHYAAILVRGEQEETKSGQQVIPVLTSFLLVSKSGGERYHLSLASVDAFSDSFVSKIPAEVLLRFRNEGNSHITPYGQIELRDLFNRVVYEGTINEGSKIVLPETERSVSVTLHRRRISLPLMLYRVQVRGTTRPAEIAYAQTSTFILFSPLWIILPIGAIIISVVFWYRHRPRLSSLSRTKYGINSGRDPVNKQTNI